MNLIRNEGSINAQAVPFEPTASYATPSIWHDLWRKLKYKYLYLLETREPTKFAVFAAVTALIRRSSYW